MSPATKWRLCFFGFFVSSAVIGLLVIDSSSWLILVFVGNIFAWSIVIRTITCPNCETPMFWTKDAFRDTPRMLRVPQSILKSRCEVCGYDLTGL